MKNVKIFLRKKKKKSDNMVIKISKRMKKQKLVEYRKIYFRIRKNAVL